MEVQFIKRIKVSVLALGFISVSLFHISTSKAEQIIASICHVNTQEDDAGNPHPHSLRGSVEDGFDRQGTGRACTEQILFISGNTYTINLQNTIDLDNDNDVDTDGDGNNLIVDGAGSSVTIDATAMQDADPTKCAFHLKNSRSIWKNMTIRVRAADKAFCDDGNNNHHTNGENGLVIQVVSSGGGTPPPAAVCNASDACCENGQWKANGAACMAPGVTDGHCNASHHCEGTVIPPADADADGTPDSTDNCPQISNGPNTPGIAAGDIQKDTDTDGRGDVCDNCPDVSNGPLTPGIAAGDIQKDTDTDGTGDVCEQATPVDTDSDGVIDTSDNCPNNSNGPLTPGIAAADIQKDTDSDGTGDVCDNDIDGDGIPNASDPHPTDADFDGDGVIDGVDNCQEQAGPLSNNGCPVAIPNPDTDGDGVANDVDQCPAQSGPATNNGCPVTNIGDPNDSDSDGVPNTDDQCPSEVGSASNHGCPVDTSDNNNNNNDTPCTGVVYKRSSVVDSSIGSVPCTGANYKEGAVMLSGAAGCSLNSGEGVFKYSYLMSLLLVAVLGMLRGMRVKEMDSTFPPLDF